MADRAGVPYQCGKRCEGPLSFSQAILPLAPCQPTPHRTAPAGNMKRYVDVLGAARGELVAQLSGEGMTAIAARNCCHPALPVIASATASGRAHIYR